MKPRVGIVMGSASDAGVMREAGRILDSFDVAYEMEIRSAHRLPQQTADYAGSAEERGLEVLIAGAGAAAHLAGVLAAHSLLPVIGVPLDSGALRGMDALLATVQMPAGIPVACMAIGKAGARNAALFAVQILSRNDPTLVNRLANYRREMRRKIKAAKI